MIKTNRIITPGGSFARAITKAVKNYAALFLVASFFLAQQILYAPPQVLASEVKIPSLLDSKEVSKFTEIKKMIDGWRYSDAFSAITEKLNSKDKLSDAEKKALYINLAVVLKMLGKPADALSNIKLAHELNASSEVCLYYLSLLSLSVSDIAAASSYAGKLKEISPENPWAYLMSASIFAFEGRARKAYDEIKKAIKLERDFF